MQLSLIVTTYNRPDALAAVLESVRRQQRLPDETLVVDDGSDERTTAVVRRYATVIPALRHFWQEHDGFRPSRMRNRGIADAASEYVALVDGDMVLHPRFIADHLNNARPGCYLQGVRVPLTERATEAFLQRPFAVCPWHIDGASKMKYAVHSNRLARWFAATPHGELRRIHSCNQSFWRHDLLDVNGFDERYNNCGGEDRDLCTRLVSIGVLQQRLRYTALAYHLYHPPGQNWSEAVQLPRASERAVRGIAELHAPAARVARPGVRRAA